MRVVSPKRTFIKKAMLLHEQACRKTPKPPRARLSRHYYDIYCLIGAGIADAALATEGLFANVVRHRAIYFPESLRDGHGYEAFFPDATAIRAKAAMLLSDHPQIRGVYAWQMGQEDPRVWRVLARLLHTRRSGR